MINTNSMSFEDGRTFQMGDTVAVATKYGTDGTGKVIGFDHRAAKVKIDLDPDQTSFGQFDRWPVKSGGFFDRARDHGIAGGEIERIIAHA